jgi:ATP-dependent Lon protease
LPQALKEHGLSDKEFVLPEASLMLLIQRYTREAGVRNLKRELSKLMRKAVKQLMVTDAKKISITAKVAEEYLGPPPFRHGEIEDDPQVGVVTGLAWTAVGGELLTIEGVITPGKGKMTVTGNLKDVMKESISAANAYVRSRCIDFGIKPPTFDTRDIHVHVPEGATPKDGPSAGIAMATAIVSIMTKVPVHHDLAMTGEITLRGRVLPIGGLKEKLLAALRAGTKKVLIPEENVRDLVDIPDSVKKGLEIVPVSRMEEVLKHALVRDLEPIEWDYDAPVKGASVDGASEDSHLAH